MADLGTLATIGSLLKKAYDIYAGCMQAPEEIRLAADHVHGMTIVLEEVRTNLVDNKRSYIYDKNNATAQTRTQNLKRQVQRCERALIRTDTLLQKYHSFKHVSGWQKFKWSIGGKAEIASTKEDLLMALMLLDTYVNVGNSGALYRVERTLEILMRKFDILAGLQPASSTPVNNNGGNRGRRTSNVGRTLVLSLIISRLKKVLLNYRRRKPNKNSGFSSNGKGSNNNRNGGNRSVPKPTTLRRPGAINRVPSGLGSLYNNNQNLNAALGNYATSIASTASNWSTKPQAGSQRAKTPDGRHNPRPGPIRRSSSMQRLMGRINASASRAKPVTTHYECWKIGVGSLAIGLKTAPQMIVHKRGQMQLRKMAAVLREASDCDRRGLNENDSRVKLILKAKNDHERRNKSQKKWSLVAARVVKRDPGRTGMVSVEKAVVILARR